MTRQILTVLLVLLATAGATMAETTTFEEPMTGRYRVDYCRFERVDCGVAAAFAFCQREGYTQIVNYDGERDVAPTRRLGDRSICRGDECDGFASITCTREGPPPALETGPGSLNYPARPDFGDDDEAEAEAEN